MKPGPFQPAIDLAVKATPPSASLILKFDGRRVRPGLEDDDVGDVDLAGCESGLSLAQQIEEFTS